MRRFIKSFHYAAKGLRYSFRGRNYKVQVAITIFVLGLAAYFRLSPGNWALVVFAAGFLLSMEATNTVVEEICNKFHLEDHPHIALIKDLSAGTVLVAAITSAIVWALVFIQYVTW